MATSIASIEDQISDRLFLLKAIAALPPKHRATLALSMAGFTQKDCGAILGLTRTTIGGLLRQAIDMLKVSMQAEIKNTDDDDAKLPPPVPGM